MGFSWEQDHSHNSVRTTFRLLSSPHFCWSPPHFTPRWTQAEPQTYVFLLSGCQIFAPCKFVLPCLSEWIKRSHCSRFHPVIYLSHLAFLHISPSWLPAPPLLSFFSQHPVSLHAHLLPTIDNIPDGAPLLATHRQINWSNNTPINSNYALISPGRSLLGAGERM